MRHTFRAALLLIVALVLTLVSTPPASAEENTATVVNAALAVVGEEALGALDADGVVAAGDVTISGEGETVARTTENGAQVIAVLRSGNTARFKMDLPKGGRLVEGPEGSLVIVKSDDEGGAILGRVEAPWAVDARGTALPTSYTVKGSTLVQNVDTKGATYPVVADPQLSAGWSWWVGPTWVVKFNKGDVHDIMAGHYWWSVGALMTIICAAVSRLGASAGIGCALGAGFYGDDFRDMFRRAWDRDPNNCVYMEFGINSGIPVEWYRYNCDGSTY